MSKVWQIVIAAILFTLIAQIVHGIGAQFAMSFYTDPNYFPVWSKLMMPSAGPPPASFMIYGLIFGLISALIYAGVYDRLKNSVPGDGIVNKGLFYGLILFLVGVIPGYLSLYLLINLPALLIFYWAVEGLVIDLAGGIVIAAIVR